MYANPSGLQQAIDIRIYVFSSQSTSYKVFFRLGQKH